MKIGEDIYSNMAIETIRVAVGDTGYQVKADETGVVVMRVTIMQQQSIQTQTQEYG